MMKFYFGKILLLLIVFSTFTLKAQAPGGIKKLSMSFESKQVKKGKSITFRGDVYYQSNGNMLTRFTYPAEQIMTNTAKGEGKLYDPVNNTVVPFQNAMLSSNSTPVAFFLNNKTSDMGLKDAGFKLKDFKTENGLQVSNYILNDKAKRSPVATVELVHNDKNVPVYMAYKDKQGNYMRKVYYTNYTIINTVQFPVNITEMLFDKADTTINRTTYSGFLTNENANSTYFNYIIPSTAKKTKL